MKRVAAISGLGLWEREGTTLLTLLLKNTYHHPQLLTKYSTLENSRKLFPFGGEMIHTVVVLAMMYSAPYRTNLVAFSTFKAKFRRCMEDGRGPTTT